MKAKITVLSGDGIGVEVTAAAVEVLQKVAGKYGHDFSFEEALIGGIAIDKTGTALPDETLSTAEQSDAILLGAVGGRNGTIRLPPCARSRAYSKFASTLNCSPICAR